MPLDPETGVFYELHGQGTPLMIGLPLFASQQAIFGDGPMTDLLRGHLDRLCDRYRVLLIDYPSIGGSRDIPPAELTADRVCADLLGVTTAAGFDRFAYWGYSWSGSVGLQLAARTDRLSALVIGGWPPLGGPYAEIHAASVARRDNPEPSSLKVLRSAAQYAQWSNYFATILGWPEAQAVAAIRVPKMVYFGAGGDLVEAGYPVRIASQIRARRGELESLGWRVLEIPGHGHEVTVHAELVVPPVRAFLDEVS